jgi:ABC-type uncharacterized transport system involved in gliding motility auxiliary subunit
MGLNAVIALVLAAGLAVALNLLAAKHPWRAELGRIRYFSLSATTRELLNRLPVDVRVVVFLSSEHELYRDIRRLFKEYEYASDRLRVEYIDPHRDLARGKELVLRYDVTEPDVVVFASDGMKKVVPVKQLFSSAIQSLMQAKKPVAYFLTGHGERQITSYDQVFGYSIVARNLRRDNIEARALNLGETPAIPQDCDVLVIAGPIHRLTRAETDMIKAFLDNSGRLLLLLDAGMDGGLAGLLEDWGVRLADDRVVGLTLTGRELLIASYGNHPITDRLASANIVTIFNGPRSVQPLAATNAPPAQSVDKPRLTALALSSQEGWAEMSPNQNPPRLDAGVDRPGPISVAVAVEKGPPRGMDVEIKPSRMVVAGDASFISNGALLAGYNTEFFMNAMNWLLERTDSLPIPAKMPGRIHIVMNRQQFQMTFGVIVVAIPAFIAAVGLLVWLRRRR